MELKEKKHRIEDAVSATRAAIEEGIVPGGGSALIHAVSVLDDDLGLTGDEAVGVRIVRKSADEPLRWIAENGGDNGYVVTTKVRELGVGNGYNAATEEYGDLVAQGVLDPVKVTRSALVNATSIAGMLLTTETLIVEKPEDEEPDAGRPRPRARPRPLTPTTRPRLGARSRTPAHGRSSSCSRRRRPGRVRCRRSWRRCSMLGPFSIDDAVPGVPLDIGRRPVGVDSRPTRSRSWRRSSSRSAVIEPGPRRRCPTRSGRRPVLVGGRRVLCAAASVGCALVDTDLETLARSCRGPPGPAAPARGVIVSRTGHPRRRRRPEAQRLMSRAMRSSASPPAIGARDRRGLLPPASARPIACGAGGRRRCVLARGRAWPPSRDDATRAERRIPAPASARSVGSLRRPSRGQRPSTGSPGRRRRASRGQSVYVSARRRSSSATGSVSARSTAARAARAARRAADRLRLADQQPATAGRVCEPSGSATRPHCVGVGGAVRSTRLHRPAVARLRPCRRRSSGRP